MLILQVVDKTKGWGKLILTLYYLVFIKLKICKFLIFLFYLIKDTWINYCIILQIVLSKCNIFQVINCVIWNFKRVWNKYLIFLIKKKVLSKSWYDTDIEKIINMVNWKSKLNSSIYLYNTILPFILFSIKLKHINYYYNYFIL